MSDHWIFFPCQMGDHRAFIFYDHGIRDSINRIAPPHLLKVRAAFKQPRPDGLPTNEEFTELSALEDGLQALVQQHDSLPRIGQKGSSSRVAESGAGLADVSPRPAG
jgi:Family of unknown function (DUF695)